VLAVCKGTCDRRFLSILGCTDEWNWWDVCMVTCVVTKSQSDPSVQNIILFNDAFWLLSIHKILKLEIHLCVWKVCCLILQLGT
jgi:hypothetical protein